MYVHFTIPDNLHTLSFQNLKKLNLVKCGNHVEDSVIFHLAEHAPLLEHLNLGGNINKFIFIL